ncbi:hypothetical protein OG21DRAFT_794502 [Imleria badia]|nr:hypothetical protein OG21DRAFT_794502 [Imleria badia]
MRTKLKHASGVPEIFVGIDWYTYLYRTTTQDSQFEPTYDGGRKGSIVSDSPHLPETLDIKTMPNQGDSLSLTLE